MKNYCWFLPFLAMPSVVQAQPNDSWASWLSTTYQTDFNNSRYLASLELAPRSRDNSSQFSQFIIRPLMGYKVTPKLQLWLGYTWQGEYDSSVKFENATQDLMQQVQWADDITPEIDFQYRLRLEQRFFADADTGHRMRHRVRLQYSVPGSNTYLVAADELFIHLNSLDDSPRAHSVQPGINQNRAYAGIGYKLSPTINLDTGYQFQYINHFGVPDFFNHIWLTNLNINF